MKVTLLQTDIIWQNPAANQKRLDGIISGLEPSDLIVLPEMFSTGFVVEPEGAAEPLSDAKNLDGSSCSSHLSCGSHLSCSSLEWMKRKSVETGAAIAGSIAVTDKAGHYYNRFYFVKPDGEVTSYDKRHLFTFGGEDKHFTSGRERVIVEWKGVRFLLLICYDLRFPVWARNRKDYDAIIIVASWPECRRKAWDTLLQARAIENQCYVLSVDRQGDDPKNHYSGGTFFISPLGEILAEAGEGDGTPCRSVSFEFNTEKLENEYRKAFPVLDDADDFTILM